MKEKIEAILNEISTDELVRINNEYCQKNNYLDDEIFSMDWLDDIINIEGMTLTEILNKYSDIITECDYFKFTIYGVESLNDLDVIDEIDLSDIIMYIIDNDEDFDIDEIREVLDSAEEEEEEE